MRYFYIVVTISIISLVLFTLGGTSAMRYADERHEADVARYRAAEAKQLATEEQVIAWKEATYLAQERAVACSEYVKEHKPSAKVEK